jgi:hypothetical protein
MSVKIDSVDFGVAGLDALGVGVGVEFAADAEAGFSGCGGVELDDCLVADEGPAAPVLGYEGEEPMLDLVPLAGAWRQVANGDFDIESLARV